MADAMMRAFVLVYKWIIIELQCQTVSFLTGKGGTGAAAIVKELHPHLTNQIVIHL